jgi:hypothetical protein
VYGNIILHRVNMCRSCYKNTLPVCDIVWYVLCIINKIYFVLCECEIFIGMSDCCFYFVYRDIYCFVVLFYFMVFCEFYFIQFRCLEVLFIKRTELTLLSYLEMKAFISLTSERQHLNFTVLQVKQKPDFSNAYIYNNCVKWKQNKSEALEILKHNFIHHVKNVFNVNIRTVCNMLIVVLYC